MDKNIECGDEVIAERSEYLGTDWIGATGILIEKGPVWYTVRVTYVESEDLSSCIGREIRFWGDCLRKKNRAGDQLILGLD